jgi:hypothetical protein
MKRNIYLKKKTLEEAKAIAAQMATLIHLPSETIRVICENLEIKHGIYRDFPTVYRTGRGLPTVIGFKVLEVLRDGAPEPFHVTEQDNGKRVYVGQKDVFIQPGVYTYTLTYEPKGLPVGEYLKMQGRFSHLGPEHIKAIQENVDEEWTV